MTDVCWLLQVKQIQISIYHLQTDRLVERFSQTLKRMLRQVVDEDRTNWDLLLPYVLFAIWETPQPPPALIPFKLLFGRRPQGLLDVANSVITW